MRNLLPLSAALAAFLGVGLFGCVSVPTVDSYVRKHRGEGSRMTIASPQDDVHRAALEMLEYDKKVHEQAKAQLPSSIPVPPRVISDDGNVLRITSMMQERYYQDFEQTSIFLDPGADGEHTDVEVIAEYFFDGTVYTKEQSNSSENSTLAAIASIAQSYAKVRKAAADKLAAQAAAETGEQAGDELAQAGKTQEAFARYMAAVPGAPAGSELEQRLREKVIRHVQSLGSPPPIPEEATRHAVRGKAFLEKAQDAGGLALAVSEYRQALELAPWWATGYFNLGLIQEKAADYSGAIQSLKLYLLAAPHSADAKAVQEKIYKLEVSQEMNH